MTNHAEPMQSALSRKDKVEKEIYNIPGSDVFLYWTILNTAKKIRTHCDSFPPLYFLTSGTESTLSSTFSFFLITLHLQHNY